MGIEKKSRSKKDYSENPGSTSNQVLKMKKSLFKFRSQPLNKQCLELISFHFEKKLPNNTPFPIDILNAAWMWGKGSNKSPTESAEFLLRWNKDLDEDEQPAKEKFQCSSDGKPDKHFCSIWKKSFACGRVWVLDTFQSQNQCIHQRHT